MNRHCVRAQSSPGPIRDCSAGPRGRVTGYIALGTMHRSVMTWGVLDLCIGQLGRESLLCAELSISIGNPHELCLFLLTCGTSEWTCSCLCLDEKLSGCQGQRYFDL